MKRFWYIWAKALGDKSGADDKTADYIACIRTLIVLVYIVTNCLISANIIKRWNM